MTNEKDGSILVRIPAGPFQMGDSDQPDNPPRTVNLPEFWIGKNDVTNAQYRGFVTATGHQSAGDWQSYAQKWGDQAPVVNVSWNDAAAYCQWAGLRLPTEEEWEKAARGTDGRKYPWGNEWDASRCRNDASGASPVGSYPSGASPYGCLDMAGNVWQWTASLYDSSHDWRVLRGGSWYNYDAVYFRAACRNSNEPGTYYSTCGFRPARSARTRETEDSHQASAFSPADRIEKALLIASEYAGFDGAHHKDWVIDQMVRALTGCPEFVRRGKSDEYRDFVVRYDGEWEEGIAP